MGLSISQTQTLKLNMTPALYQAISLLQYNNLDLSNFIRRQALENPLLQVEEPAYASGFSAGAAGRSAPDGSSKSRTDIIEQTLAAEINFRDQLHIDLHHLTLGKEIMRAADWLIDSLNDRGYLEDRLEEVTADFDLDEDDRERVLKAVQSLDPPGVGARSLQECLRLQLERAPERDWIAETIAADYIDCFLTEDWETIAEALDVDERDVRVAVERIRALDPVPVDVTKSEAALQYVVPDIRIAKSEIGFQCLLEDQLLPKVTINEEDYERYLQTSDSETKRYIRKKMNEAKWLLTGVSKRKQMLMKIAGIIIDKQNKFLNSGKKETLEPMTMKMAAEWLSVHESTVSRAVTNKYVQTPVGLLAFKDFFAKGLKTEDGSVSVYQVKSLIKSIISNENKKKPLSDQNIVFLLKDKGVECSRRVVSKYRKECGIASSSGRKQKQL